MSILILSPEERSEKLAALLSRGNEDRYNRYRYSELLYRWKWYPAEQIVDNFDKGLVEGEMQCAFCHHLSVVTVEYQCWAYERCGWPAWEGESTIRLCLYCF